MRFLLPLLLSLATIAATQSYSDIWWTPVNDPNPPKWEILPQAASKEKNEVILSKRNELGQLSNFAATPFKMLGVKYTSIEGLWQGMKYPESEKDDRYQANKVWPHTRAEVFAMAAFEAKDASKPAEAIMKANNIPWVSFNGYKIDYKGKDQDAYYDIIEAATRAKIDENVPVKKLLLATGDLTLKPDHHTEADSRKAWNYFDIHMKLRAELQKNPTKKLYSDNWFKGFAKKYNLEKIAQ